MPLNEKWGAISLRPFAVEPITGIMMPDGIFDAAIPQQKIACHLLNITGKSLVHLKVRIKSISDPNILVSWENHDVKAFVPNSSRMLMWDADFTNAQPGKHKIEFEVVPWSPALVIPLYKPQVIEQTVFVSKTTYNEAENMYVCTVPEGQLQVRINSIIAPKLLAKWTDPDFAKKHPFLGPILLKAVDLNVVLTDPYSDQHGPIPFNDPWWKVVAVVVFVVALILAVLAAFTGLGTAYIGLQGEDFVDLDSGEPACYNCEVDTWGGEAQLSVAGILSIIAMLALAVALMDEIDPWRRGQMETPVSANEKTKSERVQVKLDYPQSPTPGESYPVQVDWAYTRSTNLTEHSYHVSETNNNTHDVGGVRVWTSGDTHSAKTPIDVFASVHRANRQSYKSNELYAFAIVRGPNELSHRVQLVDDGQISDKQHSDGVFSGQFVPADVAIAANKTPDQAEGRWSVYVVVQDVNDAKQGLPALQAATHIGSYVLHSPFQLSIDGTESCTDSSDATLVVG